jgi:hypothetical protein
MRIANNFNAASGLVTGTGSALGSEGLLNNKRENNDYLNSHPNSAILTPCESRKESSARLALDRMPNSSKGGAHQEYGSSSVLQDFTLKKIHKKINHYSRPPELELARYITNYL